MKTTDLANMVISQRTVLRLTQVELAEMAGVSVRLIKKIEAGTANPGFIQLNRILQSVGLNLLINPKS